ncbi:jg14812 [Pararge aegeria aegeria]|uniref:Jg14812 protein n=1 Tax=Pararge aegeria aegeria TaxID=348720 RepID=A0A8S4QR98_9NEOP|nr:jg14812 [Pararge aegeria aegeria]
MLWNRRKTLWNNGIECYHMRISRLGLLAKYVEQLRISTRAAFGIIRDIFSSKIPHCLKTKVFEQYVLPVMTYGSETRSLTMGLIRRLRVAQRAMERAMLGVSLRDQIRNEEKN